MSKKYTTNFLEDTNGSTGSANQVLVSTAAGIDWVDGSGSGIIGGPYVTISTAQTVTGIKSFSGKIGADGGIDGLTLANGGISGSNFDITGVNQLVISDPGEGIVFTGTATMYLNAVDDATDSILRLTNATQLNLNSTARITSLVNPTGAQDAATKNYVDTEIGNIPSGLAFEGNWNASTDTPTLSGTTQDNGKFWIVSVAGSTNLSGITDWEDGDWAIYVDNGAGTDAWQKVDNSSKLSGLGVAGKVAFWSTTADLSFNNNFSYDGTYLTSTRIRVGDGTDGYFYSDSAGRTAFRDGDFYIQSNVSNAYNYAANNYHGGTSGDNQLFRGNPLSGNSWNITGAGAGAFAQTVTATGGFLVPYAAATKKPMINLVGATNYGLWHTEASNDIFSFDFGGVSKHQFFQTGNATFAGEVQAASLDINGVADISGDLTIGATSTITIGPNTSWGKSLIIGNNANNSTSDAGSIGVTNGNLHLDAAVGSSATYLNFYDGTAGVAFGNGAAGIVAWMGPDGDLWKGSSDNNGSKYWNAGNDGAGSGLDADLLDGKDHTNFGATLAAYGTTAGASGRIRCTAPFNTNSGHMFQITVSVYSSYAVHNYVVSGYMYSTTNNWYSPKAIYSGTGSPDIKVGRDSNGKAYISIANGSYTGVRVHNMTQGYYTSVADTYDPWTITIDGATENSATPSVYTTWTSGNDGAGSGLDADLLDGQQGSYYATAGSLGNYLPLAGGTMTGSVIFPGEEANIFKIAFTGASASSGISTVDQSGAGLYIGANSRVNNSGVVVFHDTLLPSSGIYFDGWNGDDMEFYTGSSGNPTKRLTIGAGGDAIFTGNVGIGMTAPLQPLSIENDSSPLIKIRNTTNGGGAGIEFNDLATSATTQNGRITYYHSDGASQGGGSSYWLTGEDDQTLVLANNGRVVVQKSGSTTEVGYGFYDDINTGMYRVSADALGFSTGGTRRLDMNSSGVRIGTGSRVTTILDQDDMSSNSNTALATQQSIKTYVDNAISGGVAPMVTFSRAGINSSTYTMIATVNGDNLASIIQMTMTGTSGNVVFACTFDITVNHSQDIHVKSMSGDYTHITLKITSDGNEDYSIEAKHDGSTTTTAEIVIFPLANEIITPTTTDPGYTGAEYEHTATEGWRFGGEDNNIESSNVIIDGNVGIGTTSPSNKLEIVGSNALRIHDGTDQGAILFRGDRDDVYIKESNYQLLFGAPSGMVFELDTNNNDGDFLNVTHRGSSRFYVNGANGNVGIGTTSPQNPLHVNGSLRIGPFLTPDRDGFVFIPGGSLNTIQANNENTNFDNNQGNIHIRTINNSSATPVERITVLSTGNIGIGTTTPGAKLEVNGQIVINSTALDGQDGFSIYNNTNQLLAITNSSTGDEASLLLMANNVTKVKLNTSGVSYLNGGNVGIGLTSPGTKLEVDGNIGIGRIAGGYTFREAVGGNERASIKSSALNELIFNYGANTEAMRINTSGKVGINTTAPGYQLDVTGNARFTETTRHNGGLYTSSTQTRNKISVWSSLSSYTIGMKSGFGYGGLGGDTTGTDYAMSFQMSNSNNRGWWWGDTTHTDVQGAMSLTTQGKLVVARSIKVGAGEDTRSAGTAKFTVVAPLSSNGVGSDFQINQGSGYSMANIQVEIPAYGDGIKVNSNSASSLDNNALTFYQGASKVGSIVIRASDTLYSTTSDYRLKENKEIISDAIGRVKLLKPIKFNWIAEPNQPKVDGFYAHELAEVVPEAVTGEKDALDFENNPDYQSIDQSKIVPLLTAALQQAIDKIEALEQRIQLIENK